MQIKEIIDGKVSVGQQVTLLVACQDGLDRQMQVQIVAFAGPGQLSARYYAPMGRGLTVVYDVTVTFMSLTGSVVQVHR